MRTGVKEMSKMIVILGLVALLFSWGCASYNPGFGYDTSGHRVSYQEMRDECMYRTNGYFTMCDFASRDYMMLLGSGAGP
jgi:hypothetical protein